MTITPMQPYGRVSIIVYLVVVDICIVDCYMYPGELCPPSHVLLYIPTETSMQYIPIYASYFPTVRCYIKYSQYITEKPTWLSFFSCNNRLKNLPACWLCGALCGLVLSTSIS